MNNWMTLLDSRISQNLVIITDSGLQVGPRPCYILTLGWSWNLQSHPVLQTKRSQKPVISILSLVVWYTQEPISGHTGQLRWSEDLSSVDLSQFPQRDLGQVSKTCPEKLASCEKSEGPIGLWRWLSSQWLLAGLLISLFGVLGFGWVFSVAILLKYTSL